MGMVYRKTGGRCYYCGAELDPFSRWNIDHIIGRKNGGSDDILNLAPTCAACNVRKKAKSVEGFREWLRGPVSLPRLVEHIEKLQPFLEEREYEELYQAVMTLSEAMRSMRVTFHFER